MEGVNIMRWRKVAVAYHARYRRDVFYWWVKATRWQGSPDSV
jgi:hypothetical protein